MPDADIGTRAELFRAAEQALARLAPDLPADAAVLLRKLYASAPTAELAGMPADQPAAAAASLYAFAADRPPGGAARVRLLAPGAGRGASAVAEIVTDDMPFLVDSALGALTRQGRVVRRLLHPVLGATRDADGRLLALGAPGAPPESMMRIEIAPAGRTDWVATEAALARALSDVRLAVADFPATLALLRQARQEVSAAPQDVEEAVAMLDWLAEENFVLVGHRRLEIAPDGGISAIEPGLGLLRDPAVPVFDALRDLAAVPPAVAAGFAAAVPLTVAKANLRSTVHRPQHADVVTTRVFGPDGRVVAVRLFVGLFAADAYNRNPRSIPLLRGKVERILAMAGVEAGSHDGRALRNILDTWPRDELVQATEAEILDGARIALDLGIRPRTAIHVRRDPFGRFATVIAWFPRESFDTRTRERVGALIAGAFQGRLSATYIALGDTPLARVHYVIGTDPDHRAEVDPAVLEAAVVQSARGFSEHLAEALVAEQGEVGGASLLLRWQDAFPPAYRESVPGGRAVADIALAERSIAEGRPAAALERSPGAPARSLTLTLANPGNALPLADMLPLFESLDLRAIEEQGWRLAPQGLGPVALHRFHLEVGTEAPPERFAALLDALAALLDGRIEADGFNRLVLRAGLGWREAWLLRSMARWLKQVGFGVEQASIETALALHPLCADLLVRRFRMRLDPALANDTTELDAAWAEALEAVTDPDADRILQRLSVLVDAVLRTNFFEAKPYLAIKIDSALAGEMPRPRPWREIFIHAPGIECCHLRAGPVARGGIRWSDRREDFRTEILGLMKAQRLKNVVIVPTGAKGGFVLKAPPTDRAAFQAAGIAAYRILIHGMLDLADNIGEEGVIPSLGSRRRDGDDPYIVAAADKGTASFSDIANGIALERGFWLGDAFASGGSQGYDHKIMGITAKGAWVMVARHFAEMGHDIQATPFTCAGVGDMSGDVFGNGLLVSRQTRLLAAFDHRHIFVDPDPDPAVSYDERARLFALPRSSWTDYNALLLSPGGAILPRSAKTLPLSPEARALLGIDTDRATPAEIMRKILRLPVDLLYFGGIGTYVKASTETQAEAGDRANDPIRADGREIRARVIGEGANLGVTQAGRIEAARTGTRLNSDALDNSAGVSTSDHEVNIKIALADAIRSGALTERQREDFLRAMTDDVGALVLRDNAQQGLAVTLEAMAGAEALSAQSGLMLRLDAAGLLDRVTAGLPGAEALAARSLSGDALTRPEIAALLPHLKLWLNEAIEASDLPDDPALEALLLDYFPPALRERFGDEARRHRLRRELLGTILSNEVANRLGCAGFARLATDSDPARAARAAVLADLLFGIGAAADAADAAPAPPEARHAVLLALRRLHEAAARLLLTLPEGSLPLEAAQAAFAPGIRRLAAGDLPAGFAWIAAGIPAEAAHLAASADALADSPGIVRLATEAGVEPEAAAEAWAEIGEAFALTPLRAAIAAARAPGTFGTRAKSALLDDLMAMRSRLAASRLGGADPAAAPGVGSAMRLAQEAAASGELAAFTVALRALSRLAA
ncbi:glutamate dehydrogenase [Humitalea rosea]|uniref:Glutamate dehydrogenase n=1 Tax=Humitalea rosea TaxID=990373 RepID=A0A2W7IV69_9PROT|nr:NAD-glutamate dehydrogenase domain-containing protein [Humitalea rosea]PZW50413.1 glutamate dehydrogenase [Humitalea rosea]